MRFPVTENIFGRKVIRAMDYEICEGKGGWVIDEIYPYCRGRAAYIYDDTLWEDTPVFPNMMQAYRFLKENWAKML